MIEISVIVPVYNTEKYIRNCIESILCQEYQEIELILIDDGSTDNSAKICDEYTQVDNRVVVVHQKNSGVSSARNKGVEVAQGKRVMFLDSDDELENGAFSEIMGHIEKNDYDVVCWSLRTNQGKYTNMSADFSVANKNDKDALYDMRLRCFTGWSNDKKKDNSMHFIVTKLIKKSLLIENDLSFNTNLKYHEDTLLTTYVLQHAESILAINRHFYIRNIHDASATQGFCSTIDGVNKFSIELFTGFVETFYSTDKNYARAMVKFRLGWFLQALQLNIFHNKSNYSNWEQYKKLRDLMKHNFYIENVELKKTKLSLNIKMLYVLLKMKMTLPMYLAVKFKLV